MSADTCIRQDHESGTGIMMFIVRLLAKITFSSSSPLLFSLSDQKDERREDSSDDEQLTATTDPCTWRCSFSSSSRSSDRFVKPLLLSQIVWLTICSIDYHLGKGVRVLRETVLLTVHSKYNKGTQRSLLLVTSSTGGPTANKSWDSQWFASP